MLVLDNKYYELILNSDNTVIANWNYVGYEPKSYTVLGNKKYYDSLISKKLSKGYEIKNDIYQNVETNIPKNKKLKSLI